MLCHNLTARMRWLLGPTSDFWAAVDCSLQNNNVLCHRSHDILVLVTLTLTAMRQSQLVRQLRTISLISGTLSRLPNYLYHDSWVSTT